MLSCASSLVIVVLQMIVTGITVLQEVHRMSNTNQPNHEFVLPGEITIGPATGDDRHELERLAELDSTTLPAGPMLVAKVGDEFTAAYSVTERRAIANPFRRTAELVELLRVHARQLGGERGNGTPRPSAPQPPGFGIGFIPRRLGRRVV